MNTPTPNEDGSPAPGNAHVPDGTQFPRKPKRRKAKLATLSVAAVAAGAFTVIQVGSAHAAGEKIEDTVTVTVSNPPLCSETDEPGCFETEEARETKKERDAKLDANVRGSVVCNPPWGEPNPTRGDESTATIDKFSAEEWRVTMTFLCKDRDDPNGPRPNV
jgi:hypothetical protein